MPVPGDNSIPQATTETAPSRTAQPGQERLPLVVPPLTIPPAAPPKPKLRWWLWAGGALWWRVLLG